MTGLVSPRAFVAGSLAVLACAGCSGESGPFEFDDVRDVQRPIASIPGRMTTAQRFGMSGAGQLGSDPHGGTMGSRPSPTDLGWNLPDGWEELAPTSMRRGNFRVAGRDDVECYITVLPGGAGGVDANVNRWRGQMGLEPLDANALANLPRQDMLGQSAVLVEMQGDYAGMGTDAKADFALYGLILEEGSSTTFLKMIGPASVLADERGRFDQLAASISRGPAAGGHSPGDGHDHGPAPAPTTAMADGSGGIGWETPAGWVRARERATRLATFIPDGTSQTECYVTVLPGNAGGLGANVNRWRAQMGAPPLTPAQIDELPRRPVMGADGILIEVEGEFTGMSGEQLSDAAMFGLMCELGSATLFVKMTGPASVVAAQRDAFLSFCDSLHQEEGR